MYGALESIVVLWRLRSHRDIIIIIIIIIIKCKDIVNLQGAEAYCVATRTACSVWTKNKQCSHRYATTSYVKPLQFNQQVPVTSRLCSNYVHWSSRNTSSRDAAAAGLVHVTGHVTVHHAVGTWSRRIPGRRRAPASRIVVGGGCLWGDGGVRRLAAPRRGPDRHRRDGRRCRFGGGRTADRRPTLADGSRRRQRPDRSFAVTTTTSTTPETPAPAAAAQLQSTLILHSTTLHFFLSHEVVAHLLTV